MTRILTILWCCVRILLIGTVVGLSLAALISFAEMVADSQTNSALEFNAAPPMPEPSQQTNVPEAVLKVIESNQANPPKPHTNGVRLAWTVSTPCVWTFVVLKTHDLTNYQIAAILPNTATNWIPPKETNATFYKVVLSEALRN